METSNESGHSHDADPVNPAPSADPPGAVRYLGIGCLMSVAGFFSGGMIAVLIGKVVGSVMGCVPETGTPACNWHIYMLTGAIVGLITLPFLTIRRLRSGAAPSDRG